MKPLDWLRLSEWSWRIEEYHRGPKQHRGAEGCMAGPARAQANHIGMSVRAFLRLSAWRWGLWRTWFDAEMDISREAARAYLAGPYITLDACRQIPTSIAPLPRCA